MSSWKTYLMRRLSARFVQVIAGLVAKAKGVTSHNDVYDLEPTHTPENPRVRRIKTPHKVDPLFWEVVRSPNMVAVLKALLGPNVRLHGSKLNVKAPKYGSPVEWHQDWAFYPHTNDDILAIGVMLDDMEIENGPLMVLPGTHRDGQGLGSPSGRAFLRGDGSDRRRRIWTIRRPSP